MSSKKHLHVAGESGDIDLDLGESTHLHVSKRGSIQVDVNTPAREKSTAAKTSLLPPSSSPGVRSSSAMLPTGSEVKKSPTTTRSASSEFLSNRKEITYMNSTFWSPRSASPRKGKRFELLRNNEKELLDVADALDRDGSLLGEGTLLREETGLLCDDNQSALSAARELGGRIAEKERDQRKLSREQNVLKSKITVLRNQIESEILAKQLVQSQIEELDEKIEHMRAKKKKTSTLDVEELKEIHHLELSVADANAQLQRSADSNALTKERVKSATADLASAEEEILRLTLQRDELKSSVASLKKKHKDLEQRMQLRTDESMRSSHADGTEIDGLSAVVKEKTAIAKELHAEVNDAVQEVKSLNEELQLNMDASKTRKIELMKNTSAKTESLRKLERRFSKVSRRKETLLNDLASSQRREMMMREQLESSETEETLLEKKCSEMSRTLRQLQIDLHVATKKDDNLAAESMKVEDEAASVQDKIDACKDAYRQLNRVLNKLNGEIDAIEGERKKLKSHDQDKTAELESSDKYTKRLMRAEEIAAEEGLALEAKLTTSRERIAELEALRAAETKEDEELKERLARNLRETEELRHTMREEEAEFVYMQHRTDLAAKRASVQIDERTFVLKRMEKSVAALVQRSDAHRRAVDDINEEALEVKGVLERSLTSVMARVHSLSESLDAATRSQDDEKKLMESKIERQHQLFAALVAIEREIGESKIERANEIAAIRRERARDEEQSRQIENDRAAAEQEHTAATRRLATLEPVGAKLKLECEKMQQRSRVLERKIQNATTLDTELREEVKSATSSLENLKKSVALKNEENSKLRRTLVRAIATIEGDTLLLRDRQKATIQKIKTLDTEKRAIAALHEELKIKDGMFDADAFTVKQRLVELNTAIQDREAAMEALGRELEEAQADKGHLTDEVARVKRESAKAHEAIVAMIEAETTGIEKAKSDIASFRDKIISLEGSCERADARSSALKQALDETNCKTSVARDALEEEQDMMNAVRERLDKTSHAADAINKDIADLDTEIVQLKAQVHEHELEEKKLLSAVKTEDRLVSEMKRAVDEVHAKQRALVEKCNATKRELDAIVADDDTGGLQIEFDRAYRAGAEGRRVLKRVLDKELLAFD